MATVREYYDLTAKALNAQREWILDNGKLKVTILGKLSFHFEENAKYWSFYIPFTNDLTCIEYLLGLQHVANGIIDESEPEQIVGYTDSPERHALREICFTRRIYLYIDSYVTNYQKNYITQLGKNLNFSILIRDKVYVDDCSLLSKPLAFISHDSKDKDSLVRELALEMDKLLCSVWYDEFTLTVGDSLRESIEKGLKETKNCIVIISPFFIENQGWAKAEFDSIYTREIHERENVILPVWHEVDSDSVYNYCPRLLDKFALNSKIGIKELAESLVSKIKA